MLARSAFHLNMHAIYDVKEVLHHSHFLEQLLFSPLAILQHTTHIANLKLTAAPYYVFYPGTPISPGKITSKKVDLFFIFCLTL
jgi:hypothetical protein